MKTKKYSKGFTLVELLVVIAIIGILAAVVLVSLSSQRNNAKRSAVMQSMKSAMPIAMGCIAGGGSVKATAAQTGGTAICYSDCTASGTVVPAFSGTTWADLSASASTKEFTYAAFCAQTGTVTTTNSLTNVTNPTCAVDTGVCI